MAVGGHQLAGSVVAQIRKTSSQRPHQYFPDLERFGLPTQNVCLQQPTAGIDKLVVQGEVELVLVENAHRQSCPELSELVVVPVPG